MFFSKIVPTIFIKVVFTALYSIFKFFLRVDNKRVTFASYRHTKIEGNLQYLYNALVQEGDAFQYNFLFKKFNSSFLGKLNYIVHMVNACYELAVSRYFIIDDFYFPAYLFKVRKGTEVVQLWHAAGAFKKFGYSTAGKKFGPDNNYLKHIKIHSNYSIVIVSSNNVISHYAEAFNTLPENIYPLGLPRTDFFFDESEKTRIKNNFLMSFPNYIGKKLILYAPTFRGRAHYQEDYQLPFDIENLCSRLGGEYVFIIRLHPYISSSITVSEKLKDSILTDTEEFSINDLMVISDMLVTDYSSVIFEYSLLEKPIVFFSYDLEEYISERDFYFEYNDFVPGPIVKNIAALVKAIHSQWSNKEKVKAFKFKFFDYLDGQSSKRIAKFLIENIKK